MRSLPRTVSRSDRGTDRRTISTRGGEGRIRRHTERSHCATASVSTGMLRLGLHHLLALLAQPVDSERDHIAGLEEFRLGLHAEPDARRRAGGDDVARLQHEELRAVPDEVPAVEDHGFGVAALAFLAVDVEPHVEALRVLDLVLGDQPGADGSERFGAFALDPLPGALDLEHALRNVVR